MEVEFRLSLLSDAPGLYKIDDSCDEWAAFHTLTLHLVSHGVHTGTHTYCTYTNAYTAQTHKILSVYSFTLSNSPIYSAFSRFSFSWRSGYLMKCRGWMSMCWKCAEVLTHLQLSPQISPFYLITTLTTSANKRPHLSSWEWTYSNLLTQTR